MVSIWIAIDKNTDFRLKYKGGSHLLGQFLNYILKYAYESLIWSNWALEFDLLQFFYLGHFGVFFSSYPILYLWSTESSFPLSNDSSIYLSPSSLNSVATWFPFPNRNTINIWLVVHILDFVGSFLCVFFLVLFGRSNIWYNYVLSGMRV